MKILLIRFSSIGDIVLTTPIIRTVKKQLGAEVHFLTRSRFESLLKDNPYVDKLFGFDDDLQTIIQELKKEGYDYIIDLHKSLRSRRVIRALGVPSLNFNKINIRKWLMVNFKINRLPKKHIVDRYFEAYKQLGLSNDGRGLDFFFSDKINEKLSLIDLPVLYNVLVLGATYFTKRIPEEILLKICKKNDLPIVLIGGKDVIDLSKDIKNKLGSTKSIVNLCGEIDIETSAKVMELSGKVFTGDTGMMHIAAALQKEIVSFWGNTIPEFGMYPYYGKDNDKNINIQVKNLSCRPCSKIGYEKCPKGHFKCMNEIELIDDIFL